ncbi:polysaccharide deacetylase family protein [Dactylosporangium sp. NPDC050588]|uniref:polysaccharide deacetylase family protein n=1 Tax=Dactylosporangium sp. NPDC050588 TaxID=3157211 RepID=UPI0033E5257E
MRRALATGLLAATAVHAAPAVTAFAPARRALLPELTGTGRRDHVALTFDDGPDPASTPHFLRLLAAHDIRATFFVLGAMLERDPALGRDMLAAGHELAVHGWTHRCLLWRTPRGTHDDLARARDLVTSLGGGCPRWFRPPYGVLTTGALVAGRRLGLQPKLWTAWGRDWEARATPTSITRTVTSTLIGGGTVLLHDSDCTSAAGSWQRTLAALPRIIGWAQDRGLRIGTLAAHQAVPR